MSEMDHQAQEAQCHDVLTGLYNRREFDHRLTEEFDRCKRYGRMFSMLMFDIDHFGAVNGNHGHITGDRILRGVADIIRTTTRSPDLVTRYGGEEFAVILPETGKSGACVAAQRILAAISGHTFGVERGQALTITVSIGVAGIPDDADSSESLVAAADSALREAKRAGRNCVRAFAREPGTETRL
jgi:diguanylate cyclase (GGDEF)-like protein